jgi:hypothetical protein
MPKITVTIPEDAFPAFEAAAKAADRTVAAWVAEVADAAAVRAAAIRYRAALAADPDLAADRDDVQRFTLGAGRRMRAVAAARDENVAA